LLVFAGAASKPPTEEAAKLYEQKTGVKIELVFGGSGSVLAQMRLAKQGISISGIVRLHGESEACRRRFCRLGKKRLYT